jgi:hypothetical protein
VRALSPSRKNDRDLPGDGATLTHQAPTLTLPRLRACGGGNGRGLAPSPAVRKRSVELNAFWPLSCIAGEDGERSETGEGLVAGQILSQRGISEPRDGRGGGGFHLFFHCSIRLVGKRPGSD